jgi:hypothetical protein
VQVITLHGLQRFLWYQLPRKWITDLDGRLHVAASLGRLLDQVGLPRYAQVCRSDQTTEILETYERDDHDGFAAFRDAEERSGVTPPATPPHRRSPTTTPRRCCPNRSTGYWTPPPATPRRG